MVFLEYELAAKLPDILGNRAHFMGFLALWPTMLYSITFHLVESGLHNIDKYVRTCCISIKVRAAVVTRLNIMGHLLELHHLSEVMDLGVKVRLLATMLHTHILFVRLVCPHLRSSRLFQAHHLQIFSLNNQNLTLLA